MKTYLMRGEMMVVNGFRPRPRHEVEKTARFNDAMRKMAEESSEFFCLLDELVKNRTAYRVYLCVLGKRRAFTAKDIMKEMDIAEATLYRAIENLNRLGLIACVGKKPSPVTKKGGPRLNRWMVV